MRILIVEDDAVSRHLLTRVLTAVGHDVTACPDAETACDAQAANHHEIVVLDWMLPGMDGLEFCRRLREQPGGRSTVVLVTTSRTSPEDFERVLEAGADDYIAKPIDPELLGVRLRVAEKRAETLRAQRAAEVECDRLADQVVEAQKLESIAALAGGIARDLGERLLAIHAGAEALRGDLAGSTDAAAHVERIDAAARRGAELAAELLTHSGRGRFLARPLDLSHEARAVDAVVREQLDRSRRVRYETAPDLPPVSGDPEQLRHVILALLRNAIEALPPEGGDVVVSTGVLDADAAYLGATHGGTDLAPDRYAFLNVADNGAGMDPTTLGRAFDPFFSTKSSGRGMGLAAALAVVRGHRGGIHLESAPGQGTDACVLLPLSAGRRTDADAQGDREDAG